MVAMIKNIANAEHKLNSQKMTVCAICGKVSLYFDNLKTIKSRERHSIGLLTEHLGKKTFISKYT